MIKLFHADFHIGAPNQLEGYGPQNLDPSNFDEWVLGDVYDLVNTKKSLVEAAEAEFKKMRALYGRRYITGNHEAQGDYDHFEWVDEEKRIAVMHGDYIFWGNEKSMKYRRKSHGAGFLKRLLWVNAVEAFEAGYDRQLKEDDLDRFVKFCKLNQIKTLIVGHLHPSKPIDFMRDGRRLIVLKRGTTMIDLDRL